MKKSVVTRFAPSPTGSFHLGSARTALFNWLYSKSVSGKFLLRIEDTDKSRSSEASLQSILSGLKWLGINHDREVCFQTQSTSYHLECAQKLIDTQNAYKHYCDDSSNEYVIKFKTPKSGYSVFKDEVCGTVKIQNSQIEDFVLVRSDGSPTYNLAVVADDIRMGITLIIRGSDHISNTAKQVLMYDALKASIPNFAHIPLIHSQEGDKLSKRHGAIDLEDYKKNGFLPEALCSYLLRLGWSCDSDDILSMDDAIELFSLEGLGKSPAKFDINKLKHINGYFMRKHNNIENVIREQMNYSSPNLHKSIPCLLSKSNTLGELVSFHKIYEPGPITIDQSNKSLLKKDILDVSAQIILKMQSSEQSIKQIVKECSFYNKKEIYTCLRIALSDKKSSNSISDILDILGQEEAIKRIEYARSLLD